jgi:hypothetical protein
MRGRRNKRGGAITFGVVLALVLVVLGIGFFMLSMYMGGQKETKNAADAGALNTAKQVLDNGTVSVQLSSDPSQQCFMDVTNDSTGGSPTNDGKVDLRRINRVWAQALMMAINADAAQNGPDGNAGQGVSNAQNACAGAQAISNALAAKLTTASNLYPFFTDISQQNTVRMISTGSTVNYWPGANWQTSLMDRTAESNIVLNGTPANNFNLPAGTSFNKSYATQCTRPSPPDVLSQTAWFLQGYTPINVLGQTFWQVPFQYGEKPHLVSSTIFNSSQQSAQPLSWTPAVPNAYSAAGFVKQGAAGQNAISWVLTNPNQPFRLSIPQSFLHIHVDTMYSKWFFFPSGYPPLELDPEQSYGYTPDSQSNVPLPGGGIACSTVTPDEAEVGLEVVGQSLDGIIFGIPKGDTSSLEADMVSRINEMAGNLNPSSPVQTFSASDLHSCLSNPATIGWLLAGTQDFYVFSPDGQTLTVQPETTAVIQATWLAQIINNDPDGTEVQLVNDTNAPVPIILVPSVTPDPYCSVIMDFGWETWDKSLYWTPGTGYNGCLGQVRVTRWTDVYSLGVSA